MPGSNQWPHTQIYHLLSEASSETTCTAGEYSTSSVKFVLSSAAAKSHSHLPTWQLLAKARRLRMWKLAFSSKQLLRCMFILGPNWSTDHGVRKLKEKKPTPPPPWEEHHSLQHRVFKIRKWFWTLASLWIEKREKNHVSLFCRGEKKNHCPLCYCLSRNHYWALIPI